MARISPMLAATALLGTIAVAVPASADPLLYSFTPTLAGAQSFTFNIDSKPTPLASTPFQFTARVQNLTVNGITRTGIFDFDFFTTAGSGGLSTNSLGSYLGPQLFSGVTTTPTLLTGRFTLSGGPSGGGGILNVSAIVAAVPEPGTWAMMIVGLGLAGSALRRRKAAVRVSYAA